MKRDVQRGAGLIELATVAAIVALLAGFAYPSLLEQQRTTRRAQAQAALIEAAQWMESYYAEHRRYDRTSAGVEVILPADLRVAPRNRASQPDYEIVFETLDAHRYTLLARPAAGAAGDPCGVLELDHVGRRASRGARTRGCWAGN